MLHGQYRPLRHPMQNADMSQDIASVAQNAMGTAGPAQGHGSTQVGTDGSNASNTPNVVQPHNMQNPTLTIALRPGLTPSTPKSTAAAPRASSDNSPTASPTMNAQTDTAPPTVSPVPRTRNRPHITGPKATPSSAAAATTIPPGYKLYCLKCP